MVPGELKGEERTLDGGELRGLESPSAVMLAERRRCATGGFRAVVENASRAMAWYNLY